MNNLKVTAHLLNGFATFDDWSPDLASLVEWHLLDSYNLLSSNPTAADVEKTQEFVHQEMPILKADIDGEWYWATSSPCYSYSVESTDRFRKRWAPGTDSPSPNWGKRKPKWSGSEGHEKSYDLPLYVRVTNAVTWYLVGDKSRIESLLKHCTGIGKKRSHGHGQVSHWTVIEFAHDWHLWGATNELMRPIPVEKMPIHRQDFAIRDWGWRPPAWMPGNKTRCAMPIHTVRKHNGQR